jgi:hypothetical protein
MVVRASRIYAFLMMQKIGWWKAARDKARAA